MAESLELSLYRAITGRPSVLNGHEVFAGVSDEELAARGIACNNFSYAQTGSLDTYRFVPGLPVFLNFSEAECWLKGRVYQRDPAIVEGKIPITLLFGNTKVLRLVRNGAVLNVDYEPSEAEIRKHISGNSNIKGEAFVQADKSSDVISILRQNELIYRPKSISDGKIVVDKGYTKYALPTTLT